MNKHIKLFFMILSVSILAVGCKKATININAGTGDGDFTGQGGTKTETFDWENAQSTAEYNMDITAGTGGSFQMVVEDADGVVVIDQTLVSGQGDDSKSGCSSSGTAGTWKVTLTVTDFSGDGSYSLSEGC